jgi:hypothetical protein
MIPPGNGWLPVKRSSRRHCTPIEIQQNGQGCTGDGLQVAQVEKQEEIKNQVQQNKERL